MKTNRIFAKLFSFLTGVVLVLLLSNLSLGFQCEEYDKVYQQINERLRQAQVSCEPVANEIEALINAFEEYRKKALSLRSFYVEAAGKLQHVISPLTDLYANHQQLIVEAGRQGLLIPPDIQKKMPEIADGQNNVQALADAGLIGKDEKVMFGVPTSAMTFDPQKISLLREYRKKEADIYFKYEDETKKAEETLAKLVPQLNKELAARINELGAAITRYQQARERVKNLLHNGQYVHCLGEPVQEQDSQSDAGLDTLNSLTSENDIPGMNHEIVALDDFQKEYRPFKLGKIPPLKQPPFLKDGTFYAKQWAGLKEQQLLGREMDVIISANNILTDICTIGKNLAQSIFIDMPKSIVQAPYELGTSIGDMAMATNARDFNDAKDRFWNVALGPVNYLKDLGERVVNDFKQIDPGQFDPTGASKIYSVITNFSLLNHALADFSAGEYTSGGLELPQSESAQDYINYINSADEQLDRLDNVNQQIQETGKQVTAAADALAAFTEFYVAFGHSAAELKVKLPELVEKLKEGNLFTDKYNTIYREYKTKLSTDLIELNKEKATILEEISKEELKTPQDLEKIKELNSDLDKLNKATEQTTQALNDLTKEESSTAAPPTGELAETIASGDTVELQNKIDPLIKEDKLLGEGAYKKVYDAGGNEVIQIISEKEKIASFETEKAGFELLEEAGLDHVGVSDYKTIELNGKEVGVRIAEKIDTATIGENMIKDNKWTNEHTKAVASAIKQANERGLILLDPNPGNVYFKETASGLKASFLEGDGIIKVADLEKKTIKIFNDTFDLSTPEGIEALQKKILKGPELVQNDMARNYFANEVKKQLGDAGLSNAENLPVGPGAYNEKLLQKEACYGTAPENFWQNFETAYNDATPPTTTATNVLETNQKLISEVEQKQQTLNKEPSAASASHQAQTQHSQEVPSIQNFLEEPEGTNYGVNLDLPEINFNTGEQGFDLFNNYGDIPGEIQ